MLKNIRAQLRLAAVLSLSRARMFFSTAWEGRWPLESGAKRGTLEPLFHVRTDRASGSSCTGTVLLHA